MSDETTQENQEVTNDDSERKHMEALASRLDAIIAGAPVVADTAAAVGEAQPKMIQYKTRKIYNKGSKAQPRYVVTYDAQVYGQPDGFVAKGDRIEVALMDDKGFLMDADGGVWLNEGENDGCGPRCPPSLRDKPLTEVVESLSDNVSADVKSALMLCVQAHGPSTMLLKVWRGLSHRQRDEIIKLLVHVAAK